MNTIKTCSLAATLILLSHCGSSGRVVEKKSSGEYQADHGPFDSQGNYIESWADNPPKRSFRKSYKSSSKTKSTSSSTSKPKTTYKPAPKPKPTTTAKTTSYKPAPKKKTTYTPAPKKKTTYKPAPKPKTSKPTPKKIIPKSKPPVIHVVKGGDTVYGLARKYGANPSKIISVNKIKNGMIKVGQRLIIPR